MDYFDQAKKLLPPGDAWQAPEGSWLAKLLKALTDGPARFHTFLEALMEEADPRTATLMIDEWERCLGLPDGCTGALTDLDERRAAVWQKLTGTGGQSRPYLIAAAARLGFTVTIEEFQPCYCDCDCDATLYDESWHATWGVLVEEAGPAAVLECVLSRARPAHTTVFFDYGV